MFSYDIRAVLQERAFPTVTYWNRLEARPRTDNFERSLRAEVRDALWLLTRQWQMGELMGDDAASPVFTRLHMATTRLTHYQPEGGATVPFDPTIPLETQVESRALTWASDSQPMSLDLRLLMGRHWLKLLQSAGLNAYRAAFIAAYAVNAPDPNTDAAIAAPVLAHVEEWQLFQAAAGRAMDGGGLYLYLKADVAHHAYDDISGVSIAQQAAFDGLAARFIAWFERLIYQPTTEAAWDASRLEYQFSVSAPTGSAGSPDQKVYTADEYYHGHLDWYNVQVNRDPVSLGGTVAPADDPRSTTTQTLLPTGVQFEGMPHTRWWRFEEGKTDFGLVKTGTTDLARLLLIEFGLVYANDWFLIPFTLPTGSIADIRGMAVTNVFGERHWIAAAGAGSDEDWQRWNMFTNSVRGTAAVAADTSLLLMHTAAKTQEGAPLDDVRLIRDEVANMVWGIEHRVPMPSGVGKPGAEAGLETLNFHKRGIATPVPTEVATTAAAAAAVRYQAMTSVPEHWIPFIPVHVEGSNRQTQLQRASMPRILEGDTAPAPAIVRPRTGLLREGLDGETLLPYFLHEEEVPRAGVRVIRAFNRTRGLNGRVFTWVATRKETGRGEGSSGLAFDQLRPTR